MNPQSQQVNREQIENALKLAEAEALLKRERIKAMDARSLAERKWITFLYETIAPALNAKGYREPAIEYTQALKYLYEAEVSILKVDLSRTEAQIAIYRAALENYGNPKLLDVN